MTRGRRLRKPIDRIRLEICRFDTRHGWFGQDMRGKGGKLEREREKSMWQYCRSYVVCSLGVLGMDVQLVVSAFNSKSFHLRLVKKM